jgi:oxygen-independent coproporphyrinogen-3 oxidase
VQAAQDELLKRIGRIHTFAEARQAVEMARRSGIRNLNMDLMFALPGQSAGNWQETLEEACAMGPEHISAYSLILEENTRLHQMVEQGLLSVPDDDEAAQMYLMARKTLTENGYTQYEISNYAREGLRCRHNIGYWQGAYYLGMGVNAHSMMPPRGDEDALWARHCNVEDTAEYIRRMEAGEDSCTLREMIGEEEAMFETMMLGLRMNEGVDCGQFVRRFGKSMEQVFGGALESLIRDGLAEKTASAFRLTERGLLLQNEALLRLMN